MEFNPKVGQEYTYKTIESATKSTEDKESDWHLHETGIGQTVGSYILVLEHEIRNEQITFIMTGTQGDEYIFKCVHISK